MDRCNQGRTQRKADYLKNGDMLDLEGDFFADPLRDNRAFELEYETVSVARVYETHVQVEFKSGFYCEFPLDHWLEVVRP